MTQLFWQFDYLYFCCTCDPLLLPAKEEEGIHLCLCLVSPNVGAAGGRALSEAVCVTHCFYVCVSVCVCVSLHADTCTCVPVCVCAPGWAPDARQNGFQDGATREGGCSWHPLAISSNYFWIYKCKLQKKRKATLKCILNSNIIRNISNVKENHDFRERSGILYHVA